MKEKIPWEGELPLGTGPFVGFGPPLKIDPYARLMSVSWVSFNKPFPFIYFLLIISLEEKFSCFY